MKPRIYNILIGAVVLAIVALLAWRYIGSQDPHALRLTEQNKDSFMDTLKESKGLSVEEVGFLSASQIRRSFAKTMGREPDSIVGKTVGDLIAAERKFQSDAKTKEDEQKRLAAEAKAKADARAAQMREAVSLTVFDKGFIPTDPTAGRFDASITLKCAYENKSGKDIRAFAGQVRFTDLFDKEIFTTSLTISDPIAAGAKATWDGTIKYNQFVETHQHLRNAEMANMKIVWLPSQILFADGSKFTADAQP